MNVKHILSHVDLLSSLGTRACLRLLIEPGKADCCEINASSLSLAQEAHVSLAGRVLIADAAYKLFSLLSEPGQIVCFLVGCI